MKNIRSKFETKADAFHYLLDRGWKFMYESLGEITMSNPELPGRLNRIIRDGKYDWKVVSL